MPHLIRGKIYALVFILNFLYSAISFNFFKFRIKRNPTSDFSQINIGDTNSHSPISDFVITFFLIKSSISSYFFCFLLKGYWYVFTESNSSETIEICIPDTVSGTSGSEVSNFHMI